MSAAVPTARINLAPEIYQKAQRDKRHKRLAITFGALVSLVALGLVVAAGIVYGAQSVAVKLLQNSISDKENKIQSYPNLVKAATAQEHLASWQQLQQQKVFISRFLNVLQQSAPTGIELSQLSIDQQNNLQASGTAQSYSLAAKFALALSAYNVQLGTNASPTQQPYFVNVQLSNLSTAHTGEVDFQITTQMSSLVTSNGN